jgi:hypothetical protein
MTQTLAFVGVLVFGWLVPWAGMRLLLPSLELSGRRVMNYRGVPVVPGGGLVWLFWVAGLRLFGAGGVSAEVSAALGLGETAAFSAATIVGAASLTVVWALLFGLIDDVFGTSHDKGFRGHIRALFAGRLSTGGLKLFGIGFVSLAAGVQIASARVPTAPGALEVWLVGICATLVVALSANLVNLLDVRPGRAFKAYGLAAVAAAVAVMFARDDGIGVALLVLVWMIGPVVALWRDDLGERTMLGDAGANAAGAAVGYVLAAALPLPGLAAAAVFLLGMNALSERVSFTQVIERVGLLRWLDGLGRRAVS